MISLFFAAVVPWLMITLFLQKQVQKKHIFTSPVFSFSFLGLLVAGFLLLPVGGLSLAYWSASLITCLSLPLVGLLLLLILEWLFSYKLFLAQDWKAAWLFGVISSLVLYPAALGLGRIDPYCWGWGTGPLFIGVAGLTLLLLIRKNRFAILLLLALASFDVQLQGSTNLWDYLIDPIYAIVALLLSLRYLFREKQESHSHFFVR